MNRSSLKWCALVGIAITVLSLLPQLHLWLARGSQWHGAYATVDGDEFLYSAYINALIDGRPRRNDPFTGRDDNPSAPLPESTFSIQFVPPLVIASLARVSGASASVAFIILIGAAGLLASLALFWFFVCLTRDNRLSAVGTFFVLCLGSAAAGQGLLGLVLRGDSTVGLSFLRRYQPAAIFFMFFLFCTLIWEALIVDNKRSRRIFAVSAGVCLSVLVFSYLYLWTAALAWVMSLILLWLFFSVRERRQSLEVLTIVGGTALLALVPYAYLLSHRARNLDETQTLVSTHRVDPFRIPEIIAALILILLVIGVRRNKMETHNPSFIFAASFALLPFVIFNQQLLTGRSMQPFHFQDFIANYAVLVSAVISIAIFCNPVTSRVLLWTAALCLLWGAVEVELPAQARYTSDVVNDEMIPTLLRLRELSIHDGTWAGLRSQGKTPALVFSPDTEVMRLLPTWTAQGTLLGLGGLDFGSASRKDPRVYAYLYYSGVDGRLLEQLLSDRSEDRFLNYYTRSAIFGHERVLPKLSFDFRPIGEAEIQEQVRVYENYVMSFAREDSLKHLIAYVIVRHETAFNFSHIDRWYERDAGERIGAYDLYRLKLRDL
jgi:hypothetical protein